METTTTSSDNRLEKMAEKAAKRAFQKAKVQAEVDLPEDFSQSDISNLLSDPSSDTDSYADSVGFDIFDHCDKLQKTQGHQISYVVKRNGEMLTVKYHPYSWEQVQKEFGAGQYQIIAKSITTKRYLKMETRVLADHKGNIETPEKVQQSSGMEFDKLILLMQQQREQDRREMKEQLERQKAEEERRRIEEKERVKETISQTQNQTIMLVEMMKMMNDKSERSTLELAKLQQAAEERAARAQDKQMQLMIQLMQSQTQNNQPKETGLSPLELMKLTKEAEESGFNRMFQLLNMARAEAEERIAYREESGGGGSREEKKSLTDRLIETMIPTITTAIAQNGLPKQVPAPVRRPLQAPPAARPGVPAQATTGVRQQTTHPRPQAPQKSNSGNGAASERTALGLPTIKFKKETKTAEVLPTPEQVEEWISPVMTDALLSEKPVPETASKLVEVVKNHGLSKENFCKIMNLEQLRGLVTKYGLPEVAYDYFKEIHAHLSTTT